MNLELKDKVAVVAGASRGIGLSIAQSLSREGCKVLICARKEETWDNAARGGREEGGEKENEDHFYRKSEGWLRENDNGD